MPPETVPWRVALLACSVLVFVMCLLAPGPGLGVSAFDGSPRMVVLEDGRGEYPIGDYLDIVEDQTGTLTIQTVASSTFSPQFKPSQKPIPNFGFSNSAFWMRFQVKNTSAVQREWLLEIAFPRINRVDLYWSDSNPSGANLPETSGFFHTASGSFVAFKDRNIKYHNLTFKLPVKPNQEQTFYLRVESQSALTIPATVWSLESFQTKARFESLVLGIYYGILLVMLVYNLFLYVAIRERIYLLYVCCSASIGLVQLVNDGLAAEFLWPASPILASRSLLVFTGLVCMWVIILGREYLALWRNAPAFNLLAVILTVWSACLTVVSALYYHWTISKATNFTALAMTIIFLIATIFCLRKGYRPAWFYLLSVLTLFAGGSISVLRNAGILHESFLVHYSFHIGTALEVVVLSLGLADRVHILQKEKREAKMAAALKEKDAEIIRLRNTELTEANLKLKELDQIKANFTAMLVHDLKSPLTIVRTTLELFEMDKSVQNSPYRELISTAERSVDKILSLVNEVLDLYRHDAQEMNLDLQSMNPESFLRDCIEAAQLEAVNNGVSIEFSIKGFLPNISADSSKLERAFANLLSNAIKFSPVGGKITVEAKTIQGVGVEAGLTLLIVSITDTGEGIPPEAIAYLFDPYRQAQSKKRKAGVGLGLAIVKRIIAAHGGNISVRSQLGVGTCFTVVLPTLQKNQNEAGPSTETKPVSERTEIIS